MPATRSKRGKKSKAAAAPPVSVPAVEPIPIPAPAPEPEHKTVDDSPMQTDQPDSTSLVETAANIVSSAEATVVNTAEVVVEMAEEVVKAASESVEETTMGGIEENSRSSTSEPGNVPVDSVKEVFSKLTLEERKAKLDELRKKMVCLYYLLLPNLGIQLNFEYHRLHPQEQIVRLLSKRQLKQKSLPATLLVWKDNENLQKCYEQKLMQRKEARM
jgi:hypothetical protein